MLTYSSKFNGTYRHLEYYLNSVDNLINKKWGANPSENPFDQSAPIPIFLMTDDETELARAHLYPKYNIIWTNTSRHQQGKPNTMLTSEQNMNKTETAIVLATEITIVEKSSLFVGTER